MAGDEADSLGMRTWVIPAGRQPEFRMCGRTES